MTYQTQSRAGQSTLAMVSLVLNTIFIIGIGIHIGQHYHSEHDLMEKHRLIPAAVRATRTANVVFATDDGDRFELYVTPFEEEDGRILSKIRGTERIPCDIMPQADMVNVDVVTQ